MKNLFENKPEDAIEGVTANSGRAVYLEYGSVWDVQTASFVRGAVIKVGATEMTVTWHQAERIADEIDGQIMADDLEDKIRAALNRHPAGNLLGKESS